MKDKFDFLETEKNRYLKWKEKGFFACDEKSIKKPFTLVIPPPNVTGKLHIGHAIDNTLQDIIIRKKRMEGYDCLYLPGTDHAGIATQAKIDNLLKEKGTTRYEIGRENFLKEAFNWSYKYQDEIYKQWQAMGLSVDYSKIRFTLDEGLSDAVFHVFKKLYDENLLYRDYRITNFDVEAKTAISNIEVIYKEQLSKLYYIKYPFTDNSGYVVIATTRPETMFADQALMVNPNDSKKKKYIGKEVFIPLTNKKIKIIADDYVDPSFGTGVVKVTPAHDPNDFLVGKRHNLDAPLCMNEDGTMNDLANNYKGLDRFLCRERLISDLKDSNLLEKIEDYKNSVGYSERTNSVVEPRLSLQWFVKMKDLSKLAINTKVKFYPTSFRKNFNNWLENCEDWCISRQLWWGHRIPVWYDKNGSIKVSKEKPEGDFYQDEDVLDTWFSSALWPFSTLGFPSKDSNLLKRYYPTSLMITGYDIMFFWVARMIFQGNKFMGEDPFKECLFHGLIRASDGQKMSKSLGNGIDPIDIIKKYGTDSLRYFLASNSTPGVDFRYDEIKVRSSWNLINKLYNIARFIILNIPSIKNLDDKFSAENIFDEYIIEKLNNLILDVNKNYDVYMFQEITKDISNFIWDDFASVYLETSKYYLKGENSLNTAKILKYVLIQILKLLHPVIPFVTDYLYTEITDKEDLMISSWPSTLKKYNFDNCLKINEIITLIRNTKAENNLSFKNKIDVILAITDKKDFNLFKKYKDFLVFFLNLESLEILNNSENKEGFILKSYKGIDLYFKKEIFEEKDDLENNAIKKRIVVLESEILRSEKILGNPNFVNKAKKEKVQEERDKLKLYKDELSSLLLKLNGK